MSIYVMSDIHGQYDAYIKMLEKINFSEEDDLIILGDILDRGPKPIAIILDIMKRPNVTVLAGNHEVMACECFGLLLQDITCESVASFNEDMIEKVSNWFLNGGRTTTDELHKYDKQTKRKIVEFIADFELYDEVEINGKTYILVHAGLGHFAPDKQLWEYELDELVWERPDYEEAYFDDKFVITGHTPTMHIEGNPRPGYIYQKNNHIAIDCGCCFSGGRLACLRLDDMEEFYVKK